LVDRLEKRKLVKRQFTSKDRRKVIIVPNEENSMKLLRPLFLELQQRTAKLIASFSGSELQTIEKYFVEATTIMRETTKSINSK
jgi:DNA-binding MarR family transcriptional regulator